MCFNFLDSVAERFKLYGHSLITRRTNAALFMIFIAAFISIVFLLIGADPSENIKTSNLVLSIIIASIIPIAFAVNFADYLSYHAGCCCCHFQTSDGTGTHDIQSAHGDNGSRAKAGSQALLGN